MTSFTLHFDTVIHLYKKDTPIRNITQHYHTFFLKRNKAPATIEHYTYQMNFKLKTPKSWLHGSTLAAH